MNNDKERQAFELWSKEQGWEIDGSPDARQRWVVWQAAHQHRPPADREGAIEVMARALREIVNDPYTGEFARTKALNALVAMEGK